MRAVQFTQFGDPEVLSVVDVDTPKAGPGEVLVRIKTAGVNFFETLLRQNKFTFTPELPTVLGVEIAGVVEALGEGVTSPAIGSRVAVPMFGVGVFGGGYAEYLAVKATSAISLPDGLSFQDATALMLQGLTALHALRQFPVEGKTVLVSSAAGGVGSLLVQLLKQHGAAKVIAVASSEKKLGLVKSLGADAVVNYAEAGWEDKIRSLTGGGVDIAYDFVGGDVTRTLAGLVTPGGAISFVAMGRFDLSPSEVEGLFGNNISIRGLALVPLITPENLREDLLDLFGRATGGSLKVIQGGEFKLEKAADAHRALESRASLGKILLSAE